MFPLLLYAGLCTSLASVFTFVRVLNVNCIVEAQVFWSASVVYPEIEAFVAVKCDSC